MDRWIIEYMADQKLIVPDNVIVVGQSAGGWAAIALSSANIPGVRAIVTFAAGRGGRVGGKPNNNCAPDRLVAATGEFGRTARIPMLWIYIENDTYFGPEYPGECTRPIPGPAEMPNITCFRRSATTDIFWSVRPTAFRCGPRWLGHSWTSTNRPTPDDGGEP